MQGSQAGNFRTHLKTHSKTQNCYTFSSQARLFLLRSCIECVNNLVTVASEMLTVTINFLKIQQCCSQSTEGSHRVPNPQFLLNIVQKGRGRGGHYEAIATTQPDAVHNLIGMTALVMWPELADFVKLDTKVIF